MKKLITTLGLAVALCFCVAYDVSAAVTTPGAGVARATATADVIDSDDFGRYGTVKVKTIKVNPSTASKYYRLRKGSVSGAILYETNSGATTTTLATDTVGFSVPSDGLYFQTDDASTNLSIILYTE